MTTSTDGASDALELTLTAEIAPLVVPSSEVLRPYLSAQNGKPHSMGEYVHVDTRLDLSPAKMTVRATAADFGGPLKDVRTRSWDDVLLGDLLEEIAGHYAVPQAGAAGSLTTAVSAGLASIRIAHVDQTNESDMHFVSRLARSYGATAKVVDRRLLFIAASDDASRSGTPLPAFTIPAGELLSATVKRSLQPEYGTVRARYVYYPGTIALNYDVGSGEPVYTLREYFVGPDEAQAAAKAAYDRLRWRTAVLDATFVGRPGLQAGYPFRLDSPPAYRGLWNVTRAVHRASESGYTTKIEADSRPSI